MMPLIRPDISFDEVSDDIRAILESGQLTRGPYILNFEKSLAEYVGAKFAISTTSATTALHAALVAQSIGPGDEVLVSDYTFPASGNAIVQTGATPVLVDNMPERFDLDPSDARAKITPKTKAIMVIHPFGQPAEMAAIQSLAREHGLWVLEDAACALGAARAGTRCGVLGDAACFSFHPRKILTTGEGGMVTTNDEALFERLLVLLAHGGTPAEVGMRFSENGFNYRMSEIQAALGLAQLRRFGAILSERKRIAALYIKAFENIEWASAPLSAPFEDCSFQSFVVMLKDGSNRNQIITRMRKQGIETTLGTYAMHNQPAFSRFGYTPGDLPHSNHAERLSLTLPLIKGMAEEDVERVVDALCDSI
jgi:perosamine synthetase